MRLRPLVRLRRRQVQLLQKELEQVEDGVDPEDDLEALHCGRLVVQGDAWP